VTDQDGIFEVEVVHQFSQIIGIGLHFIAFPGLAGASMAPAVMSNAAKAMLGEEDHL
jgi:hypothetical protein